MFRKKKEIDDSTLTQWILNGGEGLNKAMTYIIETHGEKIKGYLMKHNGSLEESEDVFHEGLAALILNVRKGSFKGDSSISTYLVSICKGIWFKKFKRMMVHQKWEETESKMEPYEYKDPLITQELKTGLDTLMGTLKDKCKEVLNMWSLHYSMAEIAEELQFSSTQIVMNKKNLCLKELRKQLVDQPQLAQLIK